jgi:hypothetical protein
VSPRGARFFSDVLLGYDAIEADRRAEIGRYLHAVVQARGFPLHVTNLWNALYFAFDLEDKAYYGAGINPDTLPIRQMGRRDPALPVGAFVRVVAATKELWAEVVYKEGRHPELELAGGELYRQVDPRVSGAPAQTAVIDGREVAVVREALVLDVDAFGRGLNELREPQYRRLLRKQKWLDEFGHLVFDAVYDPPAAAQDDDTTAYARYLFDHHRLGLLSPFLAVFLGRRASDEEAWSLLLRSFDATARLAESCADLMNWRGYFFDRSAYHAAVEDRGADTFLGADDLQHLRRELLAAPGAIGYRSMRRELLTFIGASAERTARHALFEGPGYVRSVCYANRYVADADIAIAQAESPAALVDDDESLTAIIEAGARDLASLVQESADLFAWLRPSLARQLERHFKLRERRRRKSVAMKRIYKRDLYGAVKLIELVLDEPEAERLTGREQEVNRIARRLVTRLLKDGHAEDVIPETVLAVADRAATFYRSRDRSLVRHLRIDDAWQSGGVWRVEAMRAGASITLVPLTVPLGLGYASTGATTAPPAPLALEPIASSQTGWRVALTLRDLGLGELRLTTAAVSALAAGAVTVRLRHGDLPAESSDGAVDLARRVISGMRWPFDAIPGMYVQCNVERRGSVVSVRSERLVPPEEVGGSLVHYAVDKRYYLEERGRRSVDPTTQANPTSLRDLILAAFRSAGDRRESGYALTLSRLLGALLGPEASAEAAAAIVSTLHALELERDGELYIWKPRVVRSSRAVDRTLLEEFGVSNERTRQVVRRVIPMHIRRYTHRRPSPQKIAAYPAARTASGDMTLPLKLGPGESWVREYEVGGAVDADETSDVDEARTPA